MSFLKNLWDRRFSFWNRLKQSSVFFWLQSVLCLLNLYLFTLTHGPFQLCVAAFCGLMAYVNWRQDNRRLGY